MWQSAKRPCLHTRQTIGHAAGQPYTPAHPCYMNTCWLLVCLEPMALVSGVRQQLQYLSLSDLNFLLIHLHVE